MSVGGDIGVWSVLLAIVGSALRVSTPYLFVSLGETLTEKSGRINLGLEGTLMMGAMSGYAVALGTGSPWLGVLGAGFTGAAFGLLHAGLCSLPRVNDIAVGIALFIFGTGFAVYLGKPLVHPVAPRLPDIDLGFWSSLPSLRAALQVNALLIIGILLAPAMLWILHNTRWGLKLRTVGDSADAARALGYSINGVRATATAIGGFFAGVGGAFLSLYYPGAWTENLSSGQGLMAVTLVIFARWNPINCVFAALLFGGASALGPALQAVGITSNYYLYGAAPYVLTLVLLIRTSSTKHRLFGAPSELSINK
ncbi:MAG: ABC transporter permease [Hyphomicrobiales bacterium]|nr:ABC transporter permease [Hyphomicrobiales bacterium]